MASTVATACCVSVSSSGAGVWAQPAASATRAATRATAPRRPRAFRKRACIDLLLCRNRIAKAGTRARAGRGRHRRRLRARDGTRRPREARMRSATGRAHSWPGTPGSRKPSPDKGWHGLPPRSTADGADRPAQSSSSGGTRKIGPRCFLRVPRTPTAPAGAVSISFGSPRPCRKHPGTASRYFGTTTVQTPLTPSPVLSPVLVSLT